MFWFIDKMNSRIGLYATPKLVRAASVEEAKRKLSTEINISLLDTDYCFFVLPAVEDKIVSSGRKYHGFSSESIDRDELQSIFDAMTKAKISIRVSINEPNVIRFKEN